MANILDDLVLIKQSILWHADKALEKKWITEEARSQVSGDLEKEKITIGVIGQMKNGKSTLLNALIFSRDILPAATTPMTANLTILSYAEKESVEVTFFSSQEWAELQRLAQLDEKSPVIDSARELVKAGGPIGRELTALLGTTKKITLEEMLQYVGADGKYVPITKEISIRYPSERLKSANVVDTPGFNDPVVSREERTRNFLHKADVVIVVLYAGRPFDKSDREILFEQIRVAGAGKVVLLINKYDLVLDDFGSEEQVLANVKEKMEAEIAKLDETDPLLAGVFREARPKLFSSLFALFGKMDVSDTKNLELIEHYTLLQENFPKIKTKADFLHWSKYQDLEDELERVIKKERLKIIVRKPVTGLIGRLKSHGLELEKMITARQKEKEGLSTEETSLQDRLKKLKAIGADIHRMANEAYIKIKGQIESLSLAMTNSIRAERDRIILNDLDNLPQKAKLTTNETYLVKCKKWVEDKLYEFRSRTSDKIGTLGLDIYEKYKNEVSDLDMQITEIIKNELPDDSQALLELQRSFLNILTLNVTEVDYQLDISASGWGYFFGLIRDEIIMDLRQKVEEKYSKTEISDYVNKIKQPSLEIVETLLGFRDNIVNPVLLALEDAKRNQRTKEKRLSEIGPELARLQADNESLKRTTEEMQRQFQDLING